MLSSRAGALESRGKDDARPRGEVGVAWVAEISFHICHPPRVREAQREGCDWDLIKAE